MNKRDILKSIIQDLKMEFAEMVQIAMATKDAATHPEAKAENKYDTRGLEASYLAGAQAERARQVRRVLASFESLEVVDYSQSMAIGSTALVKLLVDDKDSKWFFLLPQKGGLKIRVDTDEVITLSLDSPLGNLLINKHVGDEFSQTIHGIEKTYVIEEVF